MASHAGRFIVATLICQALLAGGCTVGGHGVQSIMNRGEIAREVMLRKAEYHADRKRADLEHKLATQEDRLRQLEAETSTDLETTMAMEVNQSIQFEDITVDVEELKKVIARAEARARAEALRQRRLPQLQREQQEALQEALQGGGADVIGPPAGPIPAAPIGQEAGPVQPVQFNGGQPDRDADMVVGVDQFGNTLPIQTEPAPRIEPWEIPFNMRLRLNLGVDNPRVQDMRVRRRPTNPSPSHHRGFRDRFKRCKKCSQGCDKCTSGCDACLAPCDACAELAALDSQSSQVTATGGQEGLAAETATGEEAIQEEAIQTATRFDAPQSVEVQPTGFDAEYQPSPTMRSLRLPPTAGATRR